MDTYKINVLLSYDEAAVQTPNHWIVWSRPGGVKEETRAENDQA